MQKSNFWSLMTICTVQYTTLQPLKVIRVYIFAHSCAQMYVKMYVYFQFMN
jgi:hypothetical protein